MKVLIDKEQLKQWKETLTHCDTRTEREEMTPLDAAPTSLTNTDELIEAALAVVDAYEHDTCVAVQSIDRLGKAL